MSVDLRVDWCSYEAAKYAVENWHYSRRMPKSKLVKIGAWEADEFIGCVIFGVGATPKIGKEFGLTAFQMCELVRVATRPHQSYTSQIMAKAIRRLCLQSPELRMIVSFADTAQGHHGGIYQATNWIYTGAQEYHAYRVNGEIVHPRTLYDRFGVGGQSVPWLRANVDSKAEQITTAAKHRYLYPLDRAMRKQIAPLAKPYPKRESCGQSVEGDTVGDQLTGAGSIPADRSTTQPVRVE